ERCQGAGCSNFVQVATSTTTSYNNTGLLSSTSYSYRVRATDDAGNLSAYSTVVTAATPAPTDTQPPTAPSNLTAITQSSAQIDLAWTASTDNVGVTNYLIERCQGPGCSNFAQVATSTTTTFSNTGLTAATSYSYRVRATDAAGNLSGYSNVATATTLSGTPTIAFVQTAYSVPQTPQSTVTARYAAAQTAGNLNIVAVGWNDVISHVLSVTDSSGNSYAQALSPTINSGIQTQ